MEHLFLVYLLDQFEEGSSRLLLSNGRSFSRTRSTCTSSIPSSTPTEEGKGLRPAPPLRDGASTATCSDVIKSLLKFIVLNEFSSSLSRLRRKNGPDVKKFPRKNNKKVVPPRKGKKDGSDKIAENRKNEI